jgi:hypothetical protein
MVTGRRTIGRFEVELEAGSGGIGTIYRARDPETGARVAVKVIRGLADADAARFAREGRLLAQIEHPGVVRHVERGTTEAGDAYLAMEWLDGEDLRDRLARAGLTMAESVTLGRRVAEALAAVHAQGLVHRDIKPGNLFLPGRLVEAVKIIDFGLARAEEGSVGPTRSGIVVGTPAYMAPEQARGQRDIDARADIYSLGCVLFKCLTGRAPFLGSDLLAVVTKVLLEEAPLVSEISPDTPAALDDLIARMLAKDPRARPESAAIVAEELAALDSIGAENEDVPEPSGARVPGLMVGEQRMAAVLLVAAADEPRPGDAAVELLVYEHGGQLDRLADGTRAVVMVGSEVATDQAARAARCALSLRAALPGVPMALSTGRSEVAGRLLVGDAIDRAARMLRDLLEAAGPAPLTIAVDEVTAALLDPRFEVVAGEHGLSLHGVREVGVGARTLLGKETAFVGRDWELSSALALFRECVEEPLARPVLVAAPAGMGKTRLGQEVVRAVAASRPEVTIWMGRGDPLRAGSALELLGQVLRGACGVQRCEPLEERRRKIVARAERHVRSFDASRVAAFLGEIVGTPFDDASSFVLRAARRDPRIMSEQMRRAWEEFLAAECAAHPVLIVIEDLQWGDLSTVRFVDGALKDLARLPWMVLALARPEVLEVFPRLWEGRNLQEIRLKPLLRRASERLVREVLGDRVSVETAARLAARADGNAFYLEELIRAVAEGGEESGGLPETVLAMVQTRLEGFDADTRRVLRAASIFGEVFWTSGVAALLGGGTGAEEAGEWVDLLIAREVLVRRPESRFAGEQELAFRHGLLREGAYAMLPERDRVMGHRLAAAWLEQRGESDAMLLAQHFELGREAERAGVYFLHAADQALRGADLDAALARAERALAGGLPHESRLRCLAMLSEAHAWRNEWEICARYAAEVTQLAAPGSEPWLKGTTAKQGAAFRLGRPQEFMEAVFSLMGVDATPETAGAVAQALSVGVNVTCLSAHFPMVPGILRQVDLLVAPLGDRDPVARGWMQLSHAFWEAWGTGDVWAALGHVQAARRDFEAASDLRDAQFARIHAAMVHYNLGSLDDAERELRGAVATGDHLIGVIRAFYLALVLIERGSLDEARAIAAGRLEAARVKAQANDFIREGEGRWLLGEIACREGDLATAEREIAAGLDALRLTPLSWQLAAATLARVRLDLGRPAEAVTLAREISEVIAEQAGVGQRAGRVPLVYAESLLAAGDPDAARAMIATARDAVLARAAKIADPEARRRFLEAVPENARTLALAEAWLPAS